VDKQVVDLQSQKLTAQQQVEIEKVSSWEHLKEHDTEQQSQGERQGLINQIKLQNNEKHKNVIG